MSCKHISRNTVYLHIQYINSFFGALTYLTALHVKFCGDMSNISMGDATYENTISIVTKKRNMIRHLPFIP